MNFWCSAVVCTVVFVLIVFRIYFKSRFGIYKGKERLDGKTVIVTGSNAGIGKVAAKDFAKRGARVIMVCRDVKKAEKVKDLIVSETGNSNIKIKYLDFSSLATVRKCANEILAEEEKIDVLLNNAGCYGVGFKQTEDGIDELIQTNHFGPFLFTNLLLGKMKKSAPSRIVNVSSLLYMFGEIQFDHFRVPIRKSYMKLYNDSKLANIYFSNELAKRIQGTGVTSNCLHPGTFQSELTRTYNSWYRKIFNFFISYWCKSLEEAAQCSIYLCVSPDVEGITGKHFGDCVMKPLKPIATDEDVGKKLWEVSEELVNLQPEERHY